MRLIDPAAHETVTLTSFGDRVSTAWLAIESIGRGTALPGRIILWLETPVPRLGRKLRRLQRRGLEILAAEPGLGPYTKFWPYLESHEPDGPLVTCDDDIVYPPWWLERLRGHAVAHENTVVAHRAHRIVMDEPQAFRPYRGWAPCLTNEPGFDHFATSVSGQLLPVGLQHELRRRGRTFLQHAPRADDIWIDFVAAEAGYPTAQVAVAPAHWAFVPGSQVVTLNSSNVWADANDSQLRDTHTPRSYARIWSDARNSTEGRAWPG
ncbi:hypothetical protein [Microbacterium telephonicum]|uniref:hypothetical protein n=1 Tax=Microbacterium telephonicum TaxID=1714841 RepID=UPI0013145D7D|nr:hypothetical protein [Microbacterium telephonicum]